MGELVQVIFGFHFMMTKHKCINLQRVYQQNRFLFFEGRDSGQAERWTGVRALNTNGYFLSYPIFQLNYDLFCSCS